jgi:Polysaccharide lyase
VDRLRDTGDQDHPPHARGAVRALRRLGPWQNPPGYRERLRRAIDARASRGRRRRLWPLGLVLAGAGALAAIAIVGRDPPAPAPGASRAVESRWPRRRALPMLVVPGDPARQSDWRPSTEGAARAWKVGEPPLAPGDWSAGFETGDRSEWQIGSPPDRSGFYEPEGAQEPVTQPVHSGRYALKVTIDAGLGRRRVTYLYRDGSLPREGRYSAWYYFPDRHRAPVFWSIMSFRGRADPGDETTLIDNLWNLTIYNREDGAMALKLWDGARMRDLLQPAPVALPTGRWVHIEAHFRQASDDTGRIAFWQDGVPIFDLDGISTAPSAWTSWLVGSVGRDVSPTPTVIFIDDVSIRSTSVPGREGSFTPGP